MAKRLKLDTSSEPPPADVQQPEARLEPFTQRETAVERSPSLTLRFKDGKLDWDGQRSATRERFAALMRDPDTLRRFNLAPATAEEAPILVSPEFVHSGLDFLGEFQAQIIRQKYKLSLDEARQIALYSTLEKDMLTPPAQRVLSKRAPDFVAKYGDEIVLAITLANIARVKFSIAGERAKQLEKAPPPPSTENGQEQAPVLQ